MIVKICGITNLDDALAASEHGATALGFNFWPRSPRFIAHDTAAALFESLPPRIWKVGLFVDEPSARIQEIASRLALDVVQLHGDGPLPLGVRLWKAIEVSPTFHTDQLDCPGAEAFLMDAPAGSARGGAGKTFDWRLVAGVSRKVVLAGGLDAGNVREAIRLAKPWGVDACSRLESAPGIKDHSKMAAFIRAALSSEAG